jgi:phosphatidylglycerol:prolipoprotein diacylglycerol transferase
VTIYGFLISLAIFVCLILGEKQVRQSGKDEKLFWNLALVSVISGFVGARIYHVIDLWAYYSVNPVKILYLQNGGLGIWGAIIGGLVGSALYLKFKKADATYWLDLIAGLVPLGQTIGRWGNYFNQENFGQPTTLPWGITIDKLPGQKVHPLFLYESILDLILFFVLLKFKRGSGKVVALYVVGYSTIRFLLEFIKMDPWVVNGINVAQFVCLAAIAVTLGYVIHLIRPRRI